MARHGLFTSIGWGYGGFSSGGAGQYAGEGCSRGQRTARIEPSAWAMTMGPLLAPEVRFRFPPSWIVVKRSGYIPNYVSLYGGTLSFVVMGGISVGGCCSWRCGAVCKCMPCRLLTRLCSCSLRYVVKFAARYTVRQFGIRRNENIATHVTVRGDKALEIIDRGLKVKEYELKAENFSDTGNFGFGVDEHIDLGIKYDPSTGIYGLDFFVVLQRPGKRITKRKRCRSRLGFSHRVRKEDSMKWFTSKFQGIILQ